MICVQLALSLTSQSHDFGQDSVITKIIALDGFIRRRKNSVLDLSVLAVASENKLTMPRLIGHQVSNCASYYVRCLAVMGDGGE